LVISGIYPLVLSLSPSSSPPKKGNPTVTDILPTYETPTAKVRLASHHTTEKKLHKFRKN
jgi:hypothetical protein